MRIGFCGAHRTGKSTLARVVAKTFKIPFLTSVASKVAADFGFNMATDNRLTIDGIDMQAEQMRAMLEQIEAAGPKFVADRTPIDAAAYLLADATASAGSHGTREYAVQYVEKAMRNTAKNFDLVILVPPAITFEAVDGKPPMNEAYQEHHHLLVRGMLTDTEIGINSYSIERDNIDRDNRIAAVLDLIGKSYPTLVIEGFQAA
jgi:nicotinamide riboside kinase